MQVEMQRIVPMLTTDDVLKRSAPHAQEYYQEWFGIIQSSFIDFNLIFFTIFLKDTSSWTNVALTAIRETFLTMKNSFVSSSNTCDIKATSSDHLDLISGKIESSVRKILRENLKDFDYEITADDVSL